MSDISVYQMAINNASNYIVALNNRMSADDPRRDAEIGIFDITSVLEIIFCKAKEEIASDIIKTVNDISPQSTIETRSPKQEVRILFHNIEIDWEKGNYEVYDIGEDDKKQIIDKMIDGECAGIIRIAENDSSEVLIGHWTIKGDK